MSDAEEFPAITFKIPGMCVACNKKYESETQLLRLTPRKRSSFLTKQRFDDFNAELAKVNTRYLGQLVCPPPSQCFNRIKK